MSEEMPLSDRDFVDIRKSVIQTIEARQTRRVWMLRTALAIIALVIATQWPTRTTKVLPPVARGDSAPRSRGVHMPALIAQPQTRPAAVVVAAPPKHRHRAPAKYHEPSPAPIRIELATADPDIRIIWITNTKESL